MHQYLFFPEFCVSVFGGKTISPVVWLWKIGRNKKILVFQPVLFTVTFLHFYVCKRLQETLVDIKVDMVQITQNKIENKKSENQYCIWSS